MGWAAARAKKQYCLLADLSVRFVQPLQIGSKIVVSGRLTRDRGRIWETEGEVTDRNGAVYARGRGKYMPLPPKESREVDAYLSYPQDAARILGPDDEPS